MCIRDSWWEGRLRNIERGVTELDDRSKLLCISLDDLVAGDREGSYSQLMEFTGLLEEQQMRQFFERDMNAGAAHKERWREGLEPQRQEDLIREYEKTLEKLEREGFHCAPVLRAAYERQPA